MLRTRLKPLLETVLVQGGASQLTGMFLRRRALILAYHNVIPDQAEPIGDRSLHLHRREFARQLDVLVRDFRVVALDKLFDDLDEGGKPRVAITFDDAYAGAVIIGLRELLKRNLPGTVFVTPSLLGGKSFWWDGLRDDLMGSRGDVFRRRVLVRHQGRDQLIRQWAAKKGLFANAVPGYARSATENDLCAAVGHGNVALASHSWSHADLSQLSDSELRDELIRSLGWLSDRFGVVIPWLAYPYGLSSPAVESAAAQAGYRAAVRVGGGWLGNGPLDWYALPRLNVPSNLSLNGFRLRLSGLVSG